MADHPLSPDEAVVSHTFSNPTPKKTRAVVFVGPYEHHSNILPWRESAAKVVMIRLAPDGGVDLADLAAQLQLHSHVPVKIGSFSAASNVSGVLTHIEPIATLLKAHGALSFWDYACAGPHVRIDMNPAGKTAVDGVFISPHKFPGGPQTPGILVVKQHVFDMVAPPTQPGGGTVLWVDRTHQRYLDSFFEREEGGTPGIVESIRSGLVMQFHHHIDAGGMMAREQVTIRKVMSFWKDTPSIHVLTGNWTGARVPIFSFLIREPQGRFLHHNFVSAVLNDLFGVQTRGGCACAGPYGMQLLGLRPEQLEVLENEVLNHRSVLKPGFTRLSLPFYVDDATVDYVMRAVALIARKGHRLVSDYRLVVSTGDCHHIKDKFTEK